MERIVKESLGQWFVPVGGALAAIAVPTWYLSPGAPPMLAPTEQPRTLDVGTPSPPPMDAVMQALPFSAARAPDRAPPPTATAETGAPAANPPRVVGIAGKLGGAPLALIVGGDGATKVVKVGETVDGWTIGAIGQGGVTFQSGGAKQMIGLDYSNKAGAAPQGPSR